MPSNLLSVEILLISSSSSPVNINILLSSVTWMDILPPREGETKLTARPKEIRGAGRNQGAWFAGKYHIKCRFFITKLKHDYVGFLCSFQVFICLINLLRTTEYLISGGQLLTCPWVK